MSYVVPVDNPFIYIKIKGLLDLGPDFRDLFRLGEDLDGGRNINAGCFGAEP